MQAGPPGEHSPARSGPTGSSHEPARGNDAMRAMGQRGADADGLARIAKLQSHINKFYENEIREKPSGAPVPVNNANLDLDYPWPQTEI